VDFAAFAHHKLKIGVSSRSLRPDCVAVYCRHSLPPLASCLGELIAERPILEMSGVAAPPCLAARTRHDIVGKS
jgi:hypothetical protein